MIDTLEPRPPGFDWRAVLAFAVVPIVFWCAVINAGLAAAG